MERVQQPLTSPEWCSFVPHLPSYSPRDQACWMVMGSWNHGILAEIFQKRSTIKLMKKCEKSGRRGELGLSENVKIMEYHGIAQNAESPFALSELAIFRVYPIYTPFLDTSNWVTILVAHPQRWWIDSGCLIATAIIKRVLAIDYPLVN